MSVIGGQVSQPLATGVTQSPAVIRAGHRRRQSKDQRITYPSRDIKLTIVKVRRLKLFPAPGTISLAGLNFKCPRGAAETLCAWPNNIGTKDQPECPTLSNGS
jgi:hypothetical protein